MIILGIDPGLATTGYGLVKKKNRQSKPCLIVYGCIRTEAGEDFAKRLLKIYRDLKKVIKKYKPDILAIENIYFAKNAKTALNIGKAMGVILLAAAEANLPIIELTPLEVKQSLTSFGRAKKEQVQKMVKMFLDMDTIPQPDDAADALAIAISALNRGKIQK